MARTPIYHEEKKAQIIQAAMATFAKYGFEGTTNKLIAEEAGKLIGKDGNKISQALIYHYFPGGKSELFKSCMQQFPPLQHVQETLHSNSNQPPEIFLRVLAQTYNNVLKTEGVLPIIRIVIGEGTRQPELVDFLLGELRSTVLVPLVTYLNREIAAGHTNALKPDQIALQLLAPIFMRRTLLATLPTDRLPFQISGDEEFIDSLVQTVLRGLFHE